MLLKLEWDLALIRYITMLALARVKWWNVQHLGIREIRYYALQAHRVEGNGIRANMNINDVDYFNPKLKLGSDYKISIFSSTIKIISVGDGIRMGDPNRSQNIRRKIDIENLDGNIVEFTMWDDMAENFDKSILTTNDVVEGTLVSGFDDFPLYGADSNHHIKEAYQLSDVPLPSFIRYSDNDEEEEKERDGSGPSNQEPEENGYSKNFVAGVYLAERLNVVLSDNWKSFAGQIYFNRHGVFLSMVWFGILLIFATIILGYTLEDAEYLRRNKNIYLPQWHIQVTLQ
ncbi:transmembrane protein 18 [Tanacetum coccineum]